MTLRHENPATELAELPNHAARARYCEAKVADYRARYYAGQWDFEQHFTAHPDSTTQGQPASAIRAIAQKRWSNDARAKDIVGLEHMWSRWLQNYAALAQMELLDRLATTLYGASRSASASVRPPRYVS